MLIPTVETERLILRAPDQQDFEPYAEFLASDRSHSVGGPKSRREAWSALAAIIGHWSLRGFGRWIIDAKSGETSLGIVGLHHPEGWPRPEIAWTIFSAGEGKSYAYEAALAARTYAYKTLGWKSVVSLIDPKNTRSVALEKRMDATPGDLFNHPVFGPLTIWHHSSPEASS